MLTSVDVLNQKFAATKFREGYDQDEVDDFLDRVTATLKEREGGGQASKPVTAQQIEGITFQTTKWREGYDQQEVDAFLDRVREQLTTAATPSDVQAYGSAPAWSPDAPASPVTPVDAVVAPAGVPIAASALVMRLQTARASRPLGAPDVVTVRLPDGTRHHVVDLTSTTDGVELTLG